MYRNNKKRFSIMWLMVILLIIGIGYAFLQGELKINGGTLFKDVTWDIHFGTPTVTTGSVSGTNVTTGATVTGTNSDSVEYNVTLSQPRDFYEFVVPVVNNGTVDAMISSVSNKIFSGTTEIEKPDYVGYRILYTNGAAVEEKQLLPVNTTQNIKVKVYYKEDAEYPDTDTPLLFKFSINYRQADNNAKEIEAPEFDEVSSWESVIEGIREGTLIPQVGDMKTVSLGFFGTHILRVANVSTPAECSTKGFSQTACGLVLEFADGITSHTMNSSFTNIGGWLSSNLRIYINNDIYNALPDVLKEAIIDTQVVSGHGFYSGELNFVTTDKLYLLSTKEIGLSIDNDTAKDETRILDYYDVNNNNTARVKKKDSSESNWWLRSAYNTGLFHCINGFGGLSTSTGTNSATTQNAVSPAFRIA